jgi:transposase
MIVTLTTAEREQLRKFQRNFGDKLRYVRVTVILLLDMGKSVVEIGDYLGIDENTVYNYRKAFKEDGLDTYLETDYKGRWGNLSCVELSQLRSELNGVLYTDTKQVINYIKEKFGVEYSGSGVTDLLHRIGYCYKKTTQVPCEAKGDLQIAFLEEQLPKILDEAKKGEAVVYYSDGVHPTHNTRSTYVWTEKGVKREQPSVSGRDRVNINGAINALDVTDIEVVETESVNAQSTMQLYLQLMEKHPTEQVIYVIQDNARYYKNAELQAWLLVNTRIKQIFLPPYSPNLNLIERLWKLMRKKVINTGFFRTKKEFRDAIIHFFQNMTDYKAELVTLLTLNFSVINSNFKT